MRHLILIRHGQASYGKANYDCLSAIGRQQAKVLGENLIHRDLPNGSIYHGSLERQRDTAQIIVNQQTLKSTETSIHLNEQPWLNELNSHQLMQYYGDKVQHPHQSTVSHSERTDQWPMKKADFASTFKQLIELWHQDPTPPFESFVQFQQRIDLGLSELVSTSPKHQPIILVSSAGVIASILQRVLQLELMQMLNLALTLNNASITEIQLSTSLDLHDLHSIYSGQKNTKHIGNLLGFNNIWPLQLQQDPKLITRL
ncbi:MAG: hypothetical protein COW84_07075 [Gammaproteobacteria bacterium CG22_combo_CG10-13_8_21_14_all_40_8]|nr:MAG: hypothetical protein COW84_07075 [Gammaproteobacteria bacterium CG22_combo_CG10-13_8_21_14_all_40_8]